jgi:DNA mismatch repair protein MutS
VQLEDDAVEIERARLAGLPATVIARARDILASLEHDELTRGGKPTISGAAPANQQQLGLFQATTSAADEKLKERIREVDINRTTPIDALRLLEELKREIES